MYLLAFIPFVGWIAVIALNVYQAHNLSKSFEKDVGYTVGLIFLPTIFYLILRFGKAEYVGTTRVKSETVTEVEKVSEENKED